jgi:hypothetical protein
MQSLRIHTHGPLLLRLHSQAAPGGPRSHGRTQCHTFRAWDTLRVALAAAPRVVPLRRAQDPLPHTEPHCSCALGLPLQP